MVEKDGKEERMRRNEGLYIDQQEAFIHSHAYGSVCKK